MNKLVYIIVCVLIIAVPMWADKLISPLEGTALGITVDTDLFAACAEEALVKSQWKITERTPGVISATFFRGRGPLKKVLRVNIEYDKSGYRIVYSSSRFLLELVDKASGEISIHYNVNIWMKRLNKAIAANYLGKSTGTKPALEAEPAEAPDTEAADTAETS